MPLSLSYPYLTLPFVVCANHPYAVFSNDILSWNLFFDLLSSSCQRITATITSLESLELERHALLSSLTALVQRTLVNLS